MYNNVDLRQSFPDLEKQMLEKWNTENTFSESLKQNRDNPFTFYDGPPFANGLPHHGHLLQSTIKDIIGRYKTMQGFYVERRWGWDCHGLPVESEVEKTLGIKDKTEIEEIGVEKFSNECRTSIMRYSDQWEQTINRFGRWVDFENGYRTMDKEYMESTWWVFKTIYDKGLIYEGLKVVPYCPQSGTPLSNSEVSEGYREVQDKAITVKFKLQDQDTYMLAWTTTPWTLISNQALAVGPNIDYVKILDTSDSTHYILAKELLPKFYKEEELYEVIETFQGSELEGKEYEAILPYFESSREGGSFRIHTADFVEIDSGTGIVHLAPYGEADFEILSAKKIKMVTPINTEGKFDASVPEYEGQLVFDANDQIIARLKEENKIIKIESYTHQYPFNDRTGTRLIYLPFKTWFLDVPQIRDKMMAANQNINWTPNHLKEGRFGNWLANAIPYGFSRNRYWGTPLPVWKSESSDKIIVIGSIEELEKYSGQKPDDIHKVVVDTIEFDFEGEHFVRVPEVFDCWFESGSMPYGQQHYPFENKEKFDANFPADFIGEAVDQTRGWFYYMVMIAAALFDKNPFQNVICTGHILGEGGQKLSKRLKNFTDPTEVMDSIGADPLRFSLVNTPVVIGENGIVTDDTIKDVVKQIILPIWNTYSFFTTYANIDNWEAQGLPENLSNQLDQWIVSQLHITLKEFTNSLDNYNIQEALMPVKKFVDDLTNWYVRRSRRRFWKNENDTDKNEGYETLHYVLKNLTQMIAPVMPFISEYIYTDLTKEQSVHLTSFPKTDAEKINQELSQRVSIVREIISAGLSARGAQKIKVRQPIQKVSVSFAKDFNLTNDETQLILEELNVKELEVIADASSLAQITYLANGQKLKEFGKDIGRIIGEAKQGNITQNEDGTYLVAGEFTLTTDQVDKRFTANKGLAAESGPNTLVAITTELTPELINEGIARDIVRQVQDLRKAADYNVEDRISVEVTSSELQNVITEFTNYICTETLSEMAEISEADKEETFELDGKEITIKVKK